jgi:predicted nucleotidyltransferase component of viral defense system
MPISLNDIRKHIIIALFSDDDLLDQLVLKGGNALEVIHKVEERATIDMDFSIPEDFADVTVASNKIEAALDKEFSRLGLKSFDFSMQKKPSIVQDGQPSWWGGYLVNFKLVDQDIYGEHANDIQALRKRSVVLGPQQKKTYKIDISKNEFCEGKEQAELDDYTIYVYSLEMIALEKLRAICQQMDSYPHVRNKRPRPRDFFDIYHVFQRKTIDLNSKENLELIDSIFGSKDVPLEFLLKIGDSRDFHSTEWESVTLSVSGECEPFDFYFDFVVDLASSVKFSGKK